jgi:hypothetical protein
MNDKSKTRIRRSVKSSTNWEYDQELSDRKSERGDALIVDTTQRRMVCGMLWGAATVCRRRLATQGAESHTAAGQRWGALMRLRRDRRGVRRSSTQRSLLAELRQKGVVAFAGRQSTADDAGALGRHWHRALLRRGGEVAAARYDRVCVTLAAGSGTAISIAGGRLHPAG